MKQQKFKLTFNNKKRETFTSFKPSTTVPISIWDLGFNKFWRMMERGRFWGSIDVEQWREGLISSKRRVDFVGEGLISSEKTASSSKKTVSSSE
ncbi:hypothetical protein QL285_029151 [Trifolium repens]|nr:hypothetical protein QL285_029151 [Trifolium repens]